MQDRWEYFCPVLEYLGLLLWVFGMTMLLPLCVWMGFALMGQPEVSGFAFLIPVGVALFAASLLKRNLRVPPIDNRQAMIVCALGWIVISAVGALPFWLGLRISYLDSYFETVSGFTTTGITMLAGLDGMSKSILFWRGFIQWLGGLGILTFFLAVLYTAGTGHRLFGAESHKVFSQRPAPSLVRSLRILWLIYGGFSAAIVLLLILEGMGVFDAISHTMTAISTGGYSPHDASIGYYRQAGYHHATLIEYTLIAAMLIGGMNFFVHYRVLRGSLRALVDSLEMRLWWAILVGATALVMADRFRRFGLEGAGFADLHATFRSSLFQVVSILTTTGFATDDIGGTLFPPGARLIFLLLMVVGGCVGSTGGGIKVLRIGVLIRMAARQIRRLTYGPAAVHPVVVDGQVVDVEELRRVAALFFLWMALLALGGLATAMLSDLDALASASGMFSALGNIGPCYISLGDMRAIHPVIKIVYVFGMLAGRLEILPLLLLVSPRTWR